jgi:DNA uptake protein ComE-like DNA-binding protein
VQKLAPQTMARSRVTSSEPAPCWSDPGTLTFLGKVRSDSASQANVWLPAGWKPRSPAQGNADAEIAESTGAAVSPAQERVDPEAQQWLVKELAAPSTQAAKAPVSPTRQNGTAEHPREPTQPPAEREAELKQRVSELESELNHVTKRAEQEAAKAGQAAKDAAELKDAGQELIEQRARLAETLGQRTEELTAAVRERDEALQGLDQALKAEKAARAGSKEAARARKELEKAQAAKKTSDSKLEETEKALIEQRARISKLEAALKDSEAQLATTQAKGGGRVKEREAALERSLSKKYKKRETDLEKRFVERQAALEKQLDEVEERLDIREAELREQGRERERTLTSRIEELESALTEAQQRAIAKPSRRSPRRKNGRLDLNQTTFEQLRDLGLSVTLSGRVISYRDSRGGFETLDELDEVPGLSRELKRVLREQLKVD